VIFELNGGYDGTALKLFLDWAPLLVFLESRRNAMGQLDPDPTSR